MNLLQRLKDLLKTPSQASSPGAQAEALAAAYLQGRGLQVLARNYRCRGGEIDLICRDAAQVVFVEVRLRSHQDYGGAAGSISVHKQRRLIVAARHWLAGRADCACRFDVILMDRLSTDAIEWHANAFQT